MPAQVLPALVLPALVLPAQVLPAQGHALLHLWKRAPLRLGNAAGQHIQLAHPPCPHWPAPEYHVLSIDQDRYRIGRRRVHATRKDHSFRVAGFEDLASNLWQVIQIAHKPITPPSHIHPPEGLTPRTVHPFPPRAG